MINLFDAFKSLFSRSKPEPIVIEEPKVSLTEIEIVEFDDPRYKSVMEGHQHFHIQGGKRTGTTLMKNLMICFKDTWVCPLETGPFGLMALPDYEIPTNIRHKNIVTKQPATGHTTELLQRGAKVISMIRDPRDVMTSVWAASQWRECKQPFQVARPDALDYLDGPLESVPGRLYVLRYEDLVSHPNKIQEKLAEFFDLEMDISFNLGYERFPVPDIHLNKEQRQLNGVRTPDTQSIGRWRQPKWKNKADVLMECEKVKEFLDKYYPEDKFK